MKRIYIPNRYELSLYVIGGKILSTSDKDFLAKPENINALIYSQVFIEQEANSVSVESLLCPDGWRRLKLDRL